MMNTEHIKDEVETESGFVEVKTENGYTINVFVLSAQDFDELKPTKESYRQAAALMSDKPKLIEKDKVAENKARILRIAAGRRTP